jgi:hypothetical protein
MVGGGVYGMVVGIGRIIMTGDGSIMTVSQVFIMILTQDGEDTIETTIGTDTGGTMNGFLPDNFNRTGGAGKIIDIGKGTECGASRAINLDRRNRDRT